MQQRGDGRRSRSLRVLDNIKVSKCTKCTQDLSVWSWESSFGTFRFWKVNVNIFFINHSPPVLHNGDSQNAPPHVRMQDLFIWSWESSLGTFRYWKVNVNVSFIKSFSTCPHSIETEHHQHYDQIGARSVHLEVESLRFATFETFCKRERHSSSINQSFSNL